MIEWGLYVRRNSSQDYISVSLMLFFLLAALPHSPVDDASLQVYMHINFRNLIVLLRHALRCARHVKGKTLIVNCHDGHRPASSLLFWSFPAPPSDVLSLCSIAVTSFMSCPRRSSSYVAMNRGYYWFLGIRSICHESTTAHARSPDSRC